MTEGKTEVFGLKSYPTDSMSTADHICSVKCGLFDSKHNGMASIKNTHHRFHMDSSFNYLSVTVNGVS